MTLQRPFGIHDSFPNAVDWRRAFSGVVPREGIFPDANTVGNEVAYAGTGWGVNARQFVAALKRGGSLGSQTYGTALVANDGVVTGAWTIDPAPVSGSRIDLLWVRGKDFSEGDSDVGAPTDGPAGADRAEADFGVTTGTPGTSPVAPSLPAGVTEIARVTTPSGAASIAGSTIVNTYAYTVAAGGVMPVRDSAGLAAYTPANGAFAVRLDTGIMYLRSAGAWATLAPGFIPPEVSTMSNGTASSGTSVIRDDVLGTVAFTAVAGRRYRAILDGFVANGDVANDKFFVQIRNGGASTPTGSSTLVASSAVVIPSAGSGGRQTVQVSGIFTPGAGTVTLAVFYQRNQGSGILTPISEVVARTLYVEEC